MRVVWAGCKGMAGLEGAVGDGSLGVPGEALGLHAWLGHELEVRGIDAVIYTRYILSLLQQEWPDIEEDMAEIVCTPAKKGPPDSTPTKKGTRTCPTLRQTRKKGRHHSPLTLTPEEIKKLAAIQCLLAVSEEDSDIEKLVEELYSKLQQQQQQKKDSRVKIECQELSQKHGDSSEDSDDCDPAQRYYAAFPALSKDTETLAASVPEGKPWAKVAGSSPRTTDTSQDRSNGSNTRGRSYSPRFTHRRKPVFVVPKVKSLGRNKSSDGSEKDAVGQEEDRAWETIPGPHGSAEWIANIWQTFNGKLWLERVMQIMRGEDDIEVKEDMSWYTQPLEMLVPQSPLATQRLYKRKSHPVFYFDFRFHLHDENGNQNKEDNMLDNEILARYIAQLKSRLEHELNLLEEDEREANAAGEQERLLQIESTPDREEETAEPITPTNDLNMSTGKTKVSPSISLNISRSSSINDSEVTPVTEESFLWTLNDSCTEHSEESSEESEVLKRAKEAERAFNRVKLLEEWSGAQIETHDASVKDAAFVAALKMNGDVFAQAQEENALNKCKESIIDQALEDVLDIVDDKSLGIGNVALPSEVECHAHTSIEESLIFSKAKEAEVAFNKVKQAEEALYRIAKSHETPDCTVDVNSIEQAMKSNELEVFPEKYYEDTPPKCHVEQDRSPKLSSSSVEGLDFYYNDYDADTPKSSQTLEEQDDWEIALKAAIQAAFEGQLEDDADYQNRIGVDRIFDVEMKTEMSSSSLFDYSGFSDDFASMSVKDSDDERGNLSAAAEEAFHRVDSVTDSINLETSCSLDEDEDDIDIDLNISKLWQLSSPMKDEDNSVFPHNNRGYILDRDCHDLFAEDDENSFEVRPIFTVGDDVNQDNVYSPPASLRNSPLTLQPFYDEGVLSDHLLYHPLHIELDLARPMGLSPLQMWLPLLSCDSCLSTTCRCQVTWDTCMDVLGKCMTPYNRATPWGPRTTSWTPGAPYGPLLNLYTDDDGPQSLVHSLNMLLSPNQDGRLTSQLWDVNVQGRFDFEPNWERYSTFENIQKYLFNLNISMQSPGTSSFIQGGLYDSSLLPEAAIWQERVDMDDLFAFMDEAWRGLPEVTSSTDSLDQLEQLRENGLMENRLQIRDRTDTLDRLDGETKEHNYWDSRSDMNLISKNIDFYASEDTAFTASIPRRLSYLTHVHSEPILKRSRVPPPTARLVPVKSLYKSDSSIFTQLGMSSSANNIIPTIEVTPDTHFRPIRTPFNGQQLDPNAYKTEDVVSPLSEEEAWRILGRKSNYQYFKRSESVDSFVPKFKVQKEREKFSQTCNVDSEVRMLEGKSKAENVLETLFSSDMQSELEMNLEDAEKLAVADMHNYEFFRDGKESPDISSDYESMGADVSSEDLSGLPLAQLWSVGEEERLDGIKSEKGKSFGSIWSCPNPTTLSMAKAQASDNHRALGPTHSCEPQMQKSKDKPDLSSQADTQPLLLQASSGLSMDIKENRQEMQLKPDNITQDVTPDKPQPQVPFIHLGKTDPTSQPQQQDFKLSMEMPWSKAVDDLQSSILTATRTLQSNDFYVDMQNPDKQGTDTEAVKATDSKMPVKDIIIPKDGKVLYEALPKDGKAPYQDCPEKDGVKLYKDGKVDIASLMPYPGDREQCVHTARTKLPSDGITCCKLPPQAAKQQHSASPGSQHSGHTSDREIGQPSSYSDMEQQPPIYSSDLEQQWLSGETSFAVQVPKPGHRHRLGSRQKPCSFYMEGNCRRADCKFAHDTSNITCRFWEEGTCFKGITCPFLHGYYRENIPSRNEDLDFSMDDTEFPELAKMHDKYEEERSSSETSDDSETAVPVIHRRKQHKAWLKSHGKLQKNKGT